jgi:hypothetical protein
VLRVLGWNYASVVHTQTDYGTTGYDALGRRKNNDFQHFQNEVFLYTDSFLSVQYTLDRQKFARKHSNAFFLQYLQFNVPALGLESVWQILSSST